MSGEIKVVREISEEKVYCILKRFSTRFHVDDIERESFQREYATKIIKRGFFVTANYHNEIVGFISGYANDTKTKCGYVSFLVISENIGGLKGVVLKELILGAVRQNENKMEKVRIEVYKDNIHAYRLYKKLGFVEIGEASPYSIYMENDLKELERRWGEC